MCDKESNSTLTRVGGVVIAIMGGLIWLWIAIVAGWPHLMAGIGLVGLLLSCGLMVRAYWRLKRFEARINNEALVVAQRRHDISEQRFRTLLESLPRVAVQGYDRDRRVIYWNEASAQLYGYDPEEAQGQALEDLIIPETMRDDVIAAHRNWIQHGTDIEAGELELVTKSGAPVCVFSHHVMLGEHTEYPLLFCVDVDLSDQKKTRRELEFITRFDALTLLPNRDTFEAELEGFLLECQRRQQHLAVLFIDLDRFAEINDTRGYEQGNALLSQVADRLRRCQCDSALLSRFDRDEFVMAFAYLQAERDVLQLIDRVRNALGEPFMLGDSHLYVTARFGVSLFPDNGNSARELIHNADVAKNRAKLSSDCYYHFFNQQIHNELMRQHEVLERLRQAITRGDELTMHYQPQIAPCSGRIENLEALIRWFPREGGSIPPSEFIPLAERFNLIHYLGQWVVRTVCRQQAQWKAAGLGGYRVDINLSGKQIAALGVFEQLDACMQEYRLTHRDIGIELTENVLVQADDNVIAALRRLYLRGMKIAIDDFGTGYSSLSYLKLFPVTALKIDRSFVIDAPRQPQDRAILTGIVSIAHRLGLEVVAEGVENQEQFELIRELNCDLVQGYYYFKPMEAAEVQHLLRDQPLISPYSYPDRR